LLPLPLRTPYLNPATIYFIQVSLFNVYQSPTGLRPPCRYTISFSMERSLER
jgi:hypothetical protein